MLGAWPPPSAALSQASPAQSLGHTMVPGDLESWLLLYLLANLSKYPKQTETITSLDLLTTLHLLQPRISLVFIAARPHCCSTFTCHALTIAKVTTEWLVMLPVLHATARNTILGNEGQVLWQHCTPERTEPGTGLISKTTSKTPGLRRMALNRYFRFPCHESACRKMKKYKGL